MEGVDDEVKAKYRYDVPLSLLHTVYTPTIHKKIRNKQQVILHRNHVLIFTFCFRVRICEKNTQNHTKAAENCPQNL